MNWKSKEEVYQTIASALTKTYGTKLYVEPGTLKFYVITNGIKKYLSTENLKEEFLLHITKNS